VIFKRSVNKNKMGIKKLQKILDDKTIPKLISLTEFAGKAIAIDAANYLYISLSPILRDVVLNTTLEREPLNTSVVINRWMYSIVNFTLKLLQNQIHPIFVFDGSSPIEKSQTLSKRKEVWKPIRERRKEIEDIIDSSTALTFPIELMKEYRDILIRDLSLVYEYIPVVQKILSTLGIPVIKAKEDGEQLCSMLCLSGYVAAVYSRDTDNYAYGCPILLTGNIEYRSRNKQKVAHIQGTRMRDILSTLDLSFFSFQDLCITLGCDYNESIPKIGPVRSVKLIQEHKSIDNFPRTIDVTPLHHKRLREMFSFISPENLITNEVSLEVSMPKSEAYELLMKYEIDSKYDEFILHVSNLPPLSFNIATPQSSYDTLIVSENKE